MPAVLCDFVQRFEPGRISCLLVPFWLPDGTRNRFSIMRLKDNLGTVQEPLFAEIDAAYGTNVHLDQAADWLRTATANRERMEWMTRRIVEQLALCL